MENHDTDWKDIRGVLRTRLTREKRRMITANAGEEAGKVHVGEAQAARAEDHFPESKPNWDPRLLLRECPGLTAVGGKNLVPGPKRWMHDQPAEHFDHHSSDRRAGTSQGSRSNRTPRLGKASGKVMPPSCPVPAPPVPPQPVASTQPAPGQTNTRSLSSGTSLWHQPPARTGGMG